MNYYLLLTLVASLQSTLTYPETVRKSNVITKLKSKIPKKFNCKSIKCPPEEEPVCVRVRNKTRGAETKDIHMVLLNKCELEYMKCHKDKLKRAKRHVQLGLRLPLPGDDSESADVANSGDRGNEDSEKSSGNEGNQVSDEQPDKMESERDEVTGEISVKPLSLIEVKKDSDGKSSGESKIFNEDGKEDSKKTSGNEGNSVSDEQPEKIYIIPLADTEVKKASDGNSSEENANSNEDEEANVDINIITKDHEDKEKDSGSNENILTNTTTADDEDESKGSDIEVNFNKNKGELVIEMPKTGSSKETSFSTEKEKNYGNIEYSEKEILTPETGAVTEKVGDEDEVANIDNGKAVPVYYELKVSNDGVDFKEYEKDCPSFCPARDVMLCARCRDGVYRTFMSVCHMRMFNCRHPKEKVELVSRYPCVLSAPYLLEAPVPKGRLAEPGDVDQVLRYIRCREKMEIAGYNISDSRCDYDFKKSTKSG